MPKKSSKRRKTQDVVSQFSNFSNITGLQDSGGSTLSSLDDCLAEMSNSQGGTTQQEEQQQDTVSPDNSIFRPKTKLGLQPSWIRQAKNSLIEDVDNWNSNFQSWAKGGIYPPGLLPNIEEEIARNFKVKELSSLLLSNDLVAGRDIRMATFERWLLDSKHEEEENVGIGKRDPVLPLQSSPDSEASQRLLSELISKHNTNNNIPRKDAAKIIAKLCRTTNLNSQELSSQHDRYRRQSPLKNGDRINVSTKTTTSSTPIVIVNILYSRKKWKKPFCFKINQTHYQKLRDRFMEIHANTTTMTTSSSSLFGGNNNNISNNNMGLLVERSFHVLILALLLRYSALSGGQLLEDLRGGGMQGGIHSSVFDVLQSYFSNNSSSSPPKSSSKEFWLEGFASPFNATLPRFASVFPDVDWHFGSVGRFLECNFDGDDEEEFCEANPPFTPGIMLTMANHMTQVLEKADNDNTRLTFAVIVPSADNKKKKNKDEAVVKHEALTSFRNLESSVYCTTHIKLKSREHGYVEGAQHLRPTQYKESSYDTSVIVLQSLKARKYGLDEKKMKQFEKDLRLAFASRHKNELTERKRKAELVK